MRAIVQDVYGQPAEVLRPAEIATPEVGPDEVLVRVRAASLRVGNLFAVRGAPIPGPAEHRHEATKGGRAGLRHQWRGRRRRITR